MSDALTAAAVQGDRLINQPGVDFGERRTWARLYSLQLSRIADLVGQLTDATGALGRIISTPVPISYSRLTSRFVTFWCALLPFVLFPVVGYITLIIVPVMCWLIFGIEELGHLIEQPFQIPDKGNHDVSLPCDKYSAEIVASIRYHTGGGYG
eukprot:gnl/MRDRNA2_/MRDRNA2_15974_c0_seq1.p1 gnl/MRDRNA2_/MRDRNA2_15974_c0~~gnl/MRDRNA2_/MRDRNA2_15974_c0_seq1.p1  ORF type:complete len:153 (+),score=9.47 gnl/MRDRNA2_/MRDRNA2_15974_c0_seq1:329-787(+)